MLQNNYYKLSILISQSEKGLVTLPFVPTKYKRMNFHISRVQFFFVCRQNKNLHKFNPAVQRPPGNKIPDAKETA